MQFEISRDSFLDALAKTVPITEKKSTLPILSHILMAAEGSKLVITATDLEVGLQIRYDCDVKEPGSMAVPARKLLEIVRELPAGNVRIELLDSGRIKIVCGISDFELAAMDPTDYPAWSSFEGLEKTAVPVEKFVYMVDKTLFASSSDDSRFNLNGILFERYENKTRLVATDGHRLALIDGDAQLSLESKALIPRKSLTEVRRILETVGGDVSLGFEPKNMVVSTDRFVMTARLIEGDYPDYRKVIPGTGDRVVRADRQELIQTLRRVAVLTSDRNKGIIVQIAPGKMELTATHPDLGTAKDAITVDYHGDEFEIIINVAYLIESLGVVDTDKISIEYQKEGGPVIIRPYPAKDYFNLVMPMRR